MIASLSAFDSLPQHSGQQIERVSAKMTTWLSKNTVAQRVILSHLQSLDGLLV